MRERVSQERGVDSVEEAVGWALMESGVAIPDSVPIGRIVAALRDAGLLSPGGVDEGGRLTRNRLAEVFIEAMDAEAERAGFSFTQNRDTPAFHRVIDRMFTRLSLSGAAPQGSDVDALRAELSFVAAELRKLPTEDVEMREALIISVRAALAALEPSPAGSGAEPEEGPDDV